MGTWIVDYDEGGCHTFWQEFKDKVSRYELFVAVLRVHSRQPTGVYCARVWQESMDFLSWGDNRRLTCTLQRIESHLENLPWGDDGIKMCSSTPAEFHGLRFDGGHTCVYWVSQCFLLSIRSIFEHISHLG